VKAGAGLPSISEEAVSALETNYIYTTETRDLFLRVYVWLVGLNNLHTVS